MGGVIFTKMGYGFCKKLLNSWRNLEKKINFAVSRSFIGKYFKLEARNTCFTTELRAATATFVTMAYIISVNATILADSGGTCSVSDCSPPFAGEDCRKTPNSGYQNCLAKTKSDLIVATVVSSMFGSIAMGLLANLPLGLAPGMGPNAYMAYNLVGFHGSGPISYSTALAVILVEGCAFLIIAACGLRARLARLIPKSIRLSCTAGIGLFIAFVGLQTHEGLGLIGPDPSTLVTITACSETNPLTGQCVSGKMQSPTFWLGAAGFLIMSYGLMKGVKGSMIYGIIFVTLISWIRDTSVTFFPNTTLGNENYDYFKKIVGFHKIESTFWVINFTNFNKSEVWVALITLLYVDILATTGTLFTLAEFGGFVNENGKFEGENLAYIVDAMSTIVGSTMGTSPIATYVESTAGMKEGGRTGLTAVIIGFYFFLSLFFTPLLSSVPPWAIGPSLVMVGVMMIKVVKDIDWGDIKVGVPAFVTMLLMPMTYSISNGIIGGIGVHVAMNLYDYIERLVKWLIETRRTVAQEQNQVCAAATGDQALEII